MTRIDSLEQLLLLVQQEHSDYFVYLGHGMRSGKSIDFTKPDFSQISVVHEIDNTEEIINIKDWEESTLFNYINKGLLYLTP